MTGPFTFTGGGGGLTAAEAQALIDAAIVDLVGTATVLGDTLGELEARIDAKVAKAGDTMTGPLVIDQGSGAVPGSLPSNGDIGFTLRSSDGVSDRLLIDGFGVHCVFSGRRANGTRAAPTAIQYGDGITEINAFGYGATDYCVFNAAKIDLNAAENWTDAAQGTRINFWVTPNGSPATGKVHRATLENNGYLLVAANASGFVADARLTVSEQTAASVAPTAGTIAHFVGANASACRVFTDSFGGGVQYAGRRANGTLSSPTNVTTNDALFQFAAFGYGASAYSGGSRANFILTASEAWTNTAQGTNALLQLTPQGSATAAEWLRMSPENGLSINGASNVVIDQNRLHRMRVYTVGTLPAAGTAGRRAAVSDANATTFASVVAGGGSNNVPVYDDGTNWRIA